MFFLNLIHQNFATKLGCGANKDVVQCLRSKSAKEIVSNYNLKNILKLQNKILLGQWSFRHCISF